MTFKEELAAIKADFEGWTGVGPCQECGLDKHVPRLVAEVERLRQKEDFLDEQECPCCLTHSCLNFRRWVNEM